MNRKVLLILVLLSFACFGVAKAQTLFTEDFEDNSIPIGWTQEGPGTWTFQTGDHNNGVGGAGHGTYNALCDHTSRNNVTKLITPTIDLSYVSSAELSFMHIQREWSGDIDALRVYYRTSTTGTWVQLVEYTSAFNSWTTEEEIILPDLSSTYQLAFECTDNYGYGVGIDYVNIIQGSSCRKPTLSNADYVQANQASLQWTENGTANDWVLEYSTSNDFTNATSVRRSGIPALVISDLSELTTYYVRVKADCGGGDESVWSNVISFTTRSEDHPAKIVANNPASDEITWEQFANYVNAGDTYEGKIVTLMEDISVTAICGSGSSPFKGTFDGQGHTITVNFTSSSDRYALFSTTQNATIQNLKVTGTINTTHIQTAGFIGYVNNNCTITNCVSDVTIVSSVNGHGRRAAGFIGQTDSQAHVIFTGCVFTGKLLGESTSGCAGFVGFNYSHYSAWGQSGSATVSFTDCVFAPAEVTMTVGSGTAMNVKSATFARSFGSGSSATDSSEGLTFTNCYYTQSFGTVQGKQAYSITGISPVTVAMNGTPTSYSVSGIEAYAVGMVYDGNIIAGDGDQVAINLSYAGSDTFTSYITTNGILNGMAVTGSNDPYTLTMTGNDAAISVMTGDFIHAIYTKADWEVFCSFVNNGHSYENETVTLEADIIDDPVTTACGLEANPFKGTFDGQGHTLRVNIASSGSTGNAPFKYISGVTIKNLIVEGTVNAANGNGNRHAGGLVGYAWSGINTFQNCLVNTTVNSSSDYAGGIIGHGKTSNIVMIGCAYTGEIKASGTNPVGGLIGWSDNLTGLTITDCLFAGTYTNSNSGKKFHPIGCTGHGDQISTDIRTISNTYYTVDHSNMNATTQTLVYGLSYKGKHAYTIRGVSPVTVAMSGTSTPYNVSGITAYTVGIVYGGNIYAGEGDNVSLTLNGSTNGYQASYGNLTGSENPYTLTMVAHNTEISDLTTPVGLPTKIVASNPASDEMTWDQFVNYINDGDTFEGQTVTLIEDITITTMAGTSKTISFHGTFDGQGHTITLNGGDFGTSSSPQGNADCAPFRFVSGATFMNLEVTGDIYSSSQRAAGFVALAGHGDLTFTNCVSSVNIHASRSSADGTHGGFIGYLQGYDQQYMTATFNGCAFTGSITTSNGTTNVGGFVGWCEWRNDNSADKGYCYLVLNNCVVSPNATCISSGSKTFSRFRNQDNSLGANEANMSNCYYTQTIGDAQGKKAYSITGVSPVTVTMNGTPTTQYNVSEIDVYASGIVFNNTLYAGDGESVSLTLSGSANGYQASYGTLEGTENPYTLTMSAHDTEIADHPLGIPTKIVLNPTASDEMSWEQFASYVNDGETFEGRTVMLMEDISVTTMVGTTSSHFLGTFDGQGHTITINYTSTDIRCGMFNTADNATFKNLRIAGSMSVSHFPSGALVGYVHYGCHIINCVSDVEITAIESNVGDKGLGGFLGEADRNSNPKIYFDGCAFTGKLIGDCNGWGGFVGRNRGYVSWSSSNSDIYFTDCVFAPTSIPSNTSGCATFARSDNYSSESNSHIHIDNCYYTQVFGQVQGKQAYSISSYDTSINPVTVELYGESTHYDVSGIDGYAIGIVYNGTIYAGNGENVSLALAGSPSGAYDVTYGTITGTENPFTLAMEAHDTEVLALTCAPPNSLAVTNIEPYSAVLNWEGDAANYNVSYIAPIFYESFENGLGDWTVYPGGDAGAVEWYVDDPSQSASLTAHSGDNVVWSFSDLNVHSDDWLVSPQLNLGGTLKYWVMSEYQDAYEVKLSTTGIEIADFTETLKSMAASENTWTEISIDLSEYEGQQGYIAFHHDYTGGFFLMIDDIGIYGWCDPIPVQGHSYALEGLMSHTEYKWKVQADCGEEDGVSKWINGDNFTTDISCYPPTNLIASNITAHGAVVSWDAEEDVTFQYSFPNNYHPNINPETLTFTDIQGNSRTLRNLRAGTEYGFFLRKNCGENGYSEIISVVFSTEVACPAPTNVEVDNVTNHTATLTWEGPSDSYIVSYGIVHVDSIGTYSFDNGEIPSDFTNSNTAWTIWESNSYSGSYCIASNNYNVASSNSTISLTATFEESGTISFYSRVSSESTNYDYGTFHIDGVQKLVEGGTTPNTWTHHSYEVEAGTHTFRWNYTKDSSVNSGEDRYYIDDIVLQSTTEEWANITVNDTTCILTGLDAETYYDVKVTADCGSEGPSVESEVVSFTTLENCPRPRDIEVEDITHYAATINWTGGIEGATVSYRTADGEWQSITVTETTASLTNLEAGTVYELKIAPACDETLESDITNFTTIDEHVKVFLTQGDWDDAPNWMDEEVSTITDVAIVCANATVTGVAEADQITFEGSSTLTIADGGQLKTNADVTATVKKSINGYGEGNGNYYLLAIPVNATASPSEYGLISDESEYDLYGWSRTARDEEWQNYKDSNFILSNGEGYLYANADDVELSFTGIVKANNVAESRTPDYDSVYGGWNLYGNPFVCDAYLVGDLGFYRMNATDDEIEVATGAIHSMEGFFCAVEEEGQTFVITREAPAKSGSLNMSLSQVTSTGSVTLDQAIVRFGEGRGLKKFFLNENSSRISITTGDANYALYNAGNSGEMMVNFNAEENGNYTLGFNAEEVNFSYLHLIDTFTGEDINLLDTLTGSVSSYSFEARTTDNANRFKLVFAIEER